MSSWPALIFWRTVTCMRSCKKGPGNLRWDPSSGPSLHTSIQGPDWNSSRESPQCTRKGQILWSPADLHRPHVSITVKGEYVKFLHIIIHPTNNMQISRCTHLKCCWILTIIMIEQSKCKISRREGGGTEWSKASPSRLYFWTKVSKLSKQDTVCKLYVGGY